MEYTNDVGVAQVIATIQQWAQDPGRIGSRDIEALSAAVRQLEGTNQAGGSVAASDIDDDLIVEEATPHRSG